MPELCLLIKEIEELNTATGPTHELRSNWRERPLFLDYSHRTNFSSTLNLTYVSPPDVAQLRAIAGLNWNLREPITISIEHDLADMIYIVRCSDLDICEIGATRDEAIEAFQAFFVADFEGWISLSDGKLTDKALKIKHKYLRYVDYQR